jgi:hypothetical protein
MIRDKYTHRDDLSRQRKYQLRMRDKGKCIVCGANRVNATHCRKHADASVQFVQAYVARKQDSVVSD